MRPWPRLDLDARNDLISCSLGVKDIIILIIIIKKIQFLYIDIFFVHKNKGIKSRWTDCSAMNYAKI